MSDLFRPEAVDHQQQKLLGTIILRQTWSTQVLTLSFGLLVLGLMAVFFLFGFARRETLAGRWLPEGGLIQVGSAQPGLVQEVRTGEGQSVQPGEVLFVLSGEREGARGPTQGRVGVALSEQRALLGEEIERARQQAEMSRTALVGKLRQSQLQLEQLRAGISLQRTRAKLSMATFKRYASSEFDGVVSHEKLDEKRADAMEQEMRLHAMQREEATAVADRNVLQAELHAMPMRIQREVAGIQGNLNTVRQAEAENDTRQRWEVRAPRAGRVTVLAAEHGQSVAAGEVMASIAPAGAALEAVLYAPSRAAGQLKAGMAAQLRFEALPYQKYGQFEGRVREISRSPVPAAELASNAGNGLLQTGPGAPMYRVRVRLSDPRLVPELAAALKAGMQLEGTLTLEHRRFYEWALEPLLGAKGGVS